ncbi:MAG: hypothetical protein RL536_294 [Candidatus Parcubacteria bacterium]|jgi:ADP-ribose pyrophosphatase YjhB (NUDIX family)
MQNYVRKRATAILVKDHQILLIRRVKPHEEYFMFPGGGVEEGETVEQGLLRESTEELAIKVDAFTPICVVENIEIPPDKNTWIGDHKYYLFSIDKYSGTPEISGPEKEKMTEENQYHLVWVPIYQISSMKNLHPQEVAKALVNYFNNS